jgi:predicted ATP-dependent endonuclease of OLD family
MQIFQEIRNIVKENDSKRNDILRPFFVLSGLVNKIFTEKSIKISNNLSLGESQEAIFSDKLSAGDKQMLSFLCYNFFYDNSVIFIDEPELSLHTDWQRLLFPTLLKQKKQNQFIIATHSPFIYSKYPDKEVIINQDKGNKDGEK